MDCIKKEFVRTDADGHKWWRVILTATETPESLDELTGADVDGMDDNIRFAAGSVLLTPDGNSVLYEDGWSGGGGTGDDGIQSITISPTIQLTPSLNNYLPMSYERFTEEYPGGTASLGLTSEDIQASTEYSFSVTPGAEWYVADTTDPENVIFGDKGQPLTIKATTTDEREASVVIIAVDAPSLSPDVKVVLLAMTLSWEVK